MRGASRGLGLAVTVLLGASTGRAQEAWEGRPLSPAERQACRPLPRALVRAVTPTHRAAAAARLGSAQAVMLDDGQAGDWIGVDAPRTGSLADRLMSDAMDRLKDHSAAAIDEHTPKWSPTDQWVFEMLAQAQAPPHPAYRPVLVRAVASAKASAEVTGTFDAAQCGDALAIRHTSPDAGAKATTRVPVIVFVARPPSAVQAWETP